MPHLRLADEDGAVHAWRVVQEYEAAQGKVLGESAAEDIRNAMQMLHDGPDLDVSSIRRRLSSALVKVERPHAECSHDDFVAYSPTMGGRWDDHVNEAGRCKACQTWLIRTTWVTRDEPDYTAMRPEQIERMKAIKGEAR